MSVPSRSGFSVAAASAKGYLTICALERWVTSEVQVPHWPTVSVEDDARASQGVRQPESAAVAARNLNLAVRTPRSANGIRNRPPHVGVSLPRVFTPGPDGPTATASSELLAADRSFRGGSRLMPPLLRLKPVAVSAAVEGPQLLSCLSDEIPFMATFP